MSLGIKVQDVADFLWEGAVKPVKTVDGLICGHPEMNVKGIATAFTGSHYVLDRTKELGANLLITHEGIYFSHHGETGQLTGNPVYETKRRTLEDGELAVYRLHDAIHRYRTDGIMEGLLATLGWEPYVEAHYPAASVLVIPQMTVSEVVRHVKSSLGLSFVRIGGNRDALCTRIGVLAGYRGGGDQVLPLFEQENLDLVIYGEGPEWETPEYVRDAAYQGRNQALIVLGHAESEAPGMVLLADRLGKRFPELPVWYIHERPLFTME